jgi:hypothetical protein
MAKVIRLVSQELEEVEVVGSTESPATGDVEGTFAAGLTLVDTGAGAATYSGGIASIEVDDAGRVLAVTTGGSSAPTVSCTNSTGSTIAAKKAVNIYDDSGTRKVRLADSGSVNNRPVNGFTVASIANGADGDVQLFGAMSGFGFADSTTGQPMFHDPSTPGEVIATATNVANERVQQVGKSYGDGVLFIDIQSPIKQA